MLLFSYGSNLSKAQFGQRCPTATLVGVGEARDYRLTFTGWSGGWGGAVATLMQDPGGKVPGAIYELRSPEDVRMLDACEGYPHVYDCVEVEVFVRRGARGRLRKITAWTYIKRNQREAQPSSAYLMTVAVGLKEHGLPVAHLAEALAGLPPAEPPRPPKQPNWQPKPARKGGGKGKKPKGKSRPKLARTISAGQPSKGKATIVRVRACLAVGCVEDVTNHVCDICGSSRPHCSEHCQAARDIYFSPW